MKNKANHHFSDSAMHTCLTHTRDAMSRYFDLRTTCSCCERRALGAFSLGVAGPWDWAALDVMRLRCVELSAVGVGKWLRKDARKVEQILWRIWQASGGMRLAAADLAAVKAFAGQARTQREIAQIRFNPPSPPASRMGELLAE